MKNIIIAIGLCFSMLFVQAQDSGQIKYKETIKLDIQMDLPDGIDLQGMFPESQTVYKDLLFTKNESVYKDAAENENTDQEMSSDDGSIKIVIQQSETDDILYTNISEKKTVHQTGFMGKEFRIIEKIERAKWRLSGEKIKYLGYECQKAVMIDEEDQEVIAWFTPEISTQVGPSHYGLLPGAILMLSTADKKLEIMATEIVLKDVSSDIKIPSKGQKVTQEEYKKIVEEKTKEMEEMMGGRSIIIGN